MAGRGSLHIGLYNRPGFSYAFSLSVTGERKRFDWVDLRLCISSATDAPASTPMKPLYPGMMSCSCGDGKVDVSPSRPATITSPGFPNNYPNFCNCLWLVCFHLAQQNSALEN